MRARRKKHNKHFLIWGLCLIFIVTGIIYINAHQKEIIDVPYLSQKGTFSTGCELVSATMLLQYYGYDVTVDQVVKKTPRKELIQTKDGLVGPHPSEAFVGNPQSANGFGCYSPVIVSVLDSFLIKEPGMKATDLSGMELEELTEKYVRNNTPVLIWATMNMKEPYVGKSWVVKSTGKKFQWVAGEHSLVLVGYDRKNYYFNDPYESNGLIAFDKSLVQMRYKSLGKQAVAIQKADKL